MTACAPIAVLACVAGGSAFARAPAMPLPSLANIGATNPPAQSAQSRRLYLDLIAGLRRTGRIHAALAHLDAFDQQYPNSPDASVLRGDCLVDIKDYGAAEIIFRKLLKGREAPAAHAGLGRISGLDGRWSDAAAEFGRAVALAPTVSDYLNDYGFALLQAGNRAEALFRIRQASELAPADPRVRNNLIIALTANGSEADARLLLAAIPDPAERSEIAAMMAQVQALNKAKPTSQP